MIDRRKTRMRDNGSPGVDIGKILAAIMHLVSQKHRDLSLDL